MSLSQLTTFLIVGKLEWTWYETCLFGLTVFAYNFKDKQKNTQLFAYFWGLVAVLAGFFLNFKVQTCLLAASFATIPYFNYANKFSPRNNAYLKPIFIGILWVIMVVALPIIDSNAPITHWIWPFLAEKFFFICALAIAYDFVDDKDDTLVGLETIYLRHGKTFSLVIISILLIMAFFCTILNFKLKLYNHYMLVFSGLTFIISFWTIIKLTQRNVESKTYKTIIDSLLILNALSICIGKALS